MPFARQPAVIARGREQLGQSNLPSQPVVVADHRLGLLQPVVDAHLGRGAPGEQTGPGRRADGAGRKGVGKTHPFGGQPVQIGRGQCPVAIAARGPLAVIIGEKEKDVGLGGRHTRASFRCALRMW